MKTLGISKASIGAMGQLVAAIQQDASERAPSEPAGPAKVVAAVATGSLPVLSAEALCCEWEEKARDYQRISGPCDEAGKIKFTAIADAFWACAAGLRRQMEATTERQPEKNVRAQPRPLG